MININEVKTEGRGYLQVYDAQKNYIIASKEQKHTRGFCPFCECEMYLSHKGDLYYYAKKSGEVHNNPICQQIEKNGKYFRVEKTSFIDLIRRLCHVSVPRGSREVRDNENLACEDEIQIEITSETGFTNLEQIYAYHLDQLKNQTQDEIKEIKKYIIYHEWAKTMLKNNKGNLLNKIVYGKFVYADFNRYMLHFLVYGTRWNCRFVLKFDKESFFRVYVKKLMIKVLSDNGSTKWKYKSEYQVALIAAEEWQKLDKAKHKEMCGKDKYFEECLGVYMTNFRTEKQICIPKGSEQALEQNII